MTEKRGYIVSAKYIPHSKPVPEEFEYTNIQKKAKIVSGSVKRQNKLKKTLHNAAQTFKKVAFKIKPVYKKAVVALLFAVVAATVFFTFLGLGFDAYINDNFIGTVRGYEETRQAISDVNAELEENAVEAISVKPSLYMRIVGQNSFIDSENLRENVKLASGALLPAVALVLNGEEVFYTDKLVTVADILKEYGASYGGETYAVAGDVQIKNTFCYEDEICQRDEAVDALKNVQCPVITKERITEKSEIMKTVKIVEDNTKRQPYRKIEREGENGVAEQIIEITRLKGEETERKVLSEKITVLPMEETVVVGTLPPLTGKGSGVFIMPAKGEISSFFGKRWGKTHKGIDIAADMGDNIVAADEGTVIFSGTQESYGKVIIIDHQNGYTTRYAHCSKLYAKKGECVGRGDLIAAVGNTGNSTGPHLHFEIRRDNTALDPLGFVNAK